MKQFSRATVALLCTAIAPLCADSPGTQNTKLEAQKQFEQRWHDNQITPVAPLKPDGNINPWIEADFIYWKTYEQGLAYAYDGVPMAPTAVPPDADRGKVFRPQFEWEPGFKIGLGNKFEHEGWDIFAQYTWLNSDAEDEEEDEECCVVECRSAKSNYWLATNACPEAIRVTCEGAKWKLNSFNVLDLEMGRNFYISKFLTLRPFGGLKFSWMKQKFKVDYDDVLFVGDAFGMITDSTAVIPIDSDVDMTFKQRQLGIGLRAGMNTAWYFCKWVGVYGDFALTGLWNRFKERREVEVEPISTSEYDSENIRNKVYDVTAVLEIGLGLFFDWRWSSDAYMFTLAAGWETQVWFNQNNFIFLMNNNAPGNLSFQGFTLKAGFAF